MFIEWIDGYAGLMGKVKHAMDLTQAAQGVIMQGVQEDEDYVGTWEDAFLFTGYENGKFSFLTNIICSTIARHGFEVKNLNHGMAHLARPDIGYNNIIVRLGWREQNCIPDRDINGNPVVLGVTEPRLYLPDIVQQLLDLEFGYTKEMVGADRGLVKHEIV